MKKLIIGSLVGGILVFLWQSLSWTLLDLHGAEYRKATYQDSIISYLSSQFPEDGQYMIPRLDDGASSDEQQKFQESMKGKPWAVVNYHKAYDTNMVSNIIRGLLVAIIAAFFVTWILMKNSNSTFGTTLISSILIGVAGYLYIPYSGHIWWQNPGATTHLVDVLLSWGLCGLWLGWWLNRK
jgi:lipopolysaccharide export LptBFGC system permease protein LptF